VPPPSNVLVVLTGRSVKALAVLAAVALVLGGCSSKKVSNATTEVKEAKAVLDAAMTVRVQLTSKGAPTTLRAAQGEIERPDGFTGSIGVTEAGIPITVPAVSQDGRFYAKLPLSTSYTAVNPTSLGFTDPAKLLDAATGLSTLLTGAVNLASGSSVRVDGDVADTITGQLQPAQVTKLLPLKGDTAVDVTFEIVPSNDQVRQITLTGNFATATETTTYTLTLDHYGDPVTITLPSP
jgi:hypothetical protein